jgi:two-component system, OmpR family, sensor histidine kinase KdpD
VRLDWHHTSSRWRKSVFGSLLAVAAAAALTACMVPLRSQLSPATTALVLVVPVVAGVSVGGALAGLVATVTCFFIYDLFFLPPYYTLYVQRAEDWAALGVYAVVMVLVARVVGVANAATAESQQREAEVRRLFDLSELLVRELPTPKLLDTIVNSVKEAFNLEGAALLLPFNGSLELAASAGRPLSDEEVQRLAASSGSPVSLEPAAPDGTNKALQVVALVATEEAVGLMALRGAPWSRAEQQLLRAFANHLALALERAGLRDDAVRARLLEEVDRLRRALVGAVSHDLRTPLATIKVSASALLDSAASLGPGDVKELAELVDAQADRLDRLVSNLLDMTRVQSGALELRRQPASVADLVDEALLVLGRGKSAGDVRWDAPADLPLVDVDHLLVRQVLANLVDNAVRYSPPGAPVTVSARRVAGDKVEVRVTDSGPGVPATEQERIFQMFNRREAGGRGGLGLAISQAFLDAHGERIWVEDASSRGGENGASFVFTLPVLVAPKHDADRAPDADRAADADRASTLQASAVQASALQVVSADQHEAI